jgi:hypothetical protein
MTTSSRLLLYEAMDPDSHAIVRLMLAEPLRAHRQDSAHYRVQANCRTPLEDNRFARYSAPRCVGITRKHLHHTPLQEKRFELGTIRKPHKVFVLRIQVSQPPTFSNPSALVGRHLPAGKVHQF